MIYRYQIIARPVTELYRKLSFNRGFNMDVFTRVPKDKLMALADKLEEDYPHSATVCNALLLHQQNHASLHNFFTLQDHPDSHVVLYKNKNKPTISFFCCESEVQLLLDSLKQTSLVPWDHDALFFWLPGFMREGLKELYKEKTGLELGSYPNNVYTCQIEEKTELRCPAGVRLCRIGKKGVERMYETWEYGWDTPIENFLSMIKNDPLIGVYEEKGEEQKEKIISYDPTKTNQESTTNTSEESNVIDIENLPFAGDEEKCLSWFVLSPSGWSGVLRTEDEHHRKGYGALAVEACSYLILSQGYIPQVFVGPHNKASNGLFSKMKGYKQTGNFCWAYSMKGESEFPR